MKLFKVTYQYQVYKHLGGEGWRTKHMYIEAHSDSEARELWHALSYESGATLKLLTVQDATDSDAARYYSGEAD